MVKLKNKTKKKEKCWNWRLCTTLRLLCTACVLCVMSLYSVVFPTLNWVDPPPPTLSLLSAIRPSIHPYIYSTSGLIRAIYSYTPAREPDGPARLKSFLSCSLLAGVPHSTSAVQSFSLFPSLELFLSPSLCRRVVHSRKFRRCRCLGAASTKPVKLLSLSLFFIWLLVPLCSTTSTIVNYFWLESPHHFLPAELNRSFVFSHLFLLVYILGLVKQRPLQYIAGQNNTCSLLPYTLFLWNSLLLSGSSDLLLFRFLLRYLFNDPPLPPTSRNVGKNNILFPLLVFCCFFF